MKQRWPAPAKLNLFLAINARMEDGYHHLQTLFQFLDHSDTLLFSLRNDGQLLLENTLTGVNNADNLVIRAATLLRECAIKQQRLSPKAGVVITLDKIIPMGGGLGGGSSNAATTLVALNQLWDTGFTTEQLSQMGLQLGADVPVFVQGVSAFAQGVGEQLQPVHPPEKWYLVAHPGITISTADIFNDPDLIRNTPLRPLSALLTQPWRNDCEPIVRKRFPKVDELLLWLLQYAPSRLTGTGACVYAEFETAAAAQAVLNQAPSWVQGFVAKGLNLSPLTQACEQFSVSSKLYR